MLTYRVTVYDKQSGDLICWFSTPRKKDADAYKFRAECLHTRCEIEEMRHGLSRREWTEGQPPQYFTEEL